MTDTQALIERLEALGRAELPLRAVDGPDYAEIIGASGEKMALTTSPELVLALNALPEIIAALREREGEGWRPIKTFSGEGQKDSVIVAVICDDREPVIGEAYWNPEAYGGTWWWAGTSYGDYHADPIEDCNFGRVAFWQPLPTFSTPPTGSAAAHAEVR